MSLEIEQYGNNLVEEDSQSLSSIYRQISIEFNDCFDEVYEHNNILAYIDEYFPIEIKHIDNTKFINDVTFFNTTLVGLIKFCVSKNFNKINIIFIIFCDYFDLPYNLMFNNLHPKIKDNIIKRYIKLVGNLEYQKQKQKYNEQKDYVQPTLFDLING